MKAQARVDEHPLYPWLSRIKGVGEKTIARLIMFIDNHNEIRDASELIELVGFIKTDKEENKGELYSPLALNKRKPYNQILQGVCFNLSMNLLRARGKFFDYYEKEKEKITKRLKTEGKIIVSASEIPRDKRGRYITTGGFVSRDLVRHMARREMIKHFLTQLWLERIRVNIFVERHPG